MINEKGMCDVCEHKENCNMHKKNPDVKVTDCQRFSMSKEMQKIYKAIAMFAVHGCD